ncbi:hypothetical protein ACFXJ8_26260 [Nonomuraea sp. NPDC059194]|uniref:hypothetical protein n=1 Tax=Nonomuraea sp. NPDC059194 TaxID=3346764 RepID=UPI0036ABC9DA
MMTSPRPYCCASAEFDGIPADVHAEVCREPAPAVQDALASPLADDPGTGNTSQEVK